MAIILIMKRMKPLSTDMVRKVFLDFYTTESSTITLPVEFEKREFGFLLSSEGKMYRHKRFSSQQEFEVFLGKTAFSDAYYSSAYYEDPEAEMNKKGWLGADLIFDIDADHIVTSCGKIHDEWSCKDCSFCGRGVTPINCPICGGEKFETKTWLCEECLDSAKTETLKLLDILTSDFGLSRKDIHVFFSGHRGYHVQVENDEVKNLDSISRKEIVDYVRGLGFISNSLDKASSFRSADSLGVAKVENYGYGWQRRILKIMQGFLGSTDYRGLLDIGISKSVASTIIDKRGTIQKHLDTSGQYDVIRGVGPETWKKIISHCVRYASANVDTVVTTDIHRLIRLQNTLHGKTGLKKIECGTSDVMTFDPLKTGVALKNGNATVLVSDVPSFRIGDQMFGPYRNTRVKLPMAAATLLVCKGRAEVLDYDI